MPYGMSKRIGGDTKAIDAKMERCVRDVMATGKDKVTAIKICKTSISKHTAMVQALNKKK